MTKPVTPLKVTCETCFRILPLLPHLDPKRKYFCSEFCRDWERQFLVICQSLPSPEPNAWYFINITPRKEEP